MTHPLQSLMSHLQAQMQESTNRPTLPELARMVNDILERSRIPHTVIQKVASRPELLTCPQSWLEDLSRAAFNVKFQIMHLEKFLAELCQGTIDELDRMRMADILATRKEAKSGNK